MDRGRSSPKRAEKQIFNLASHHFTGLADNKNYPTARDRGPTVISCQAVALLDSIALSGACCKCALAVLNSFASQTKRRGLVVG